MTRALPDRIVTPRLVLREPRLADAAALFEAYTQDAEVARYTVWRPHTALFETQAFVEQCVATWAAGYEQSYVIVQRDHEDRRMGMLAARVWGHTVDLGYVLARAYWRRGLMTEAVRAVAATILAIPRFFRVQATCDVDNSASARTLEKAGLTREGRLERYTVHPNVSAAPRASYMYARCR